jgi:hypothetical protein
MFGSLNLMEVEGTEHGGYRIFRPASANAPQAPTFDLQPGSLVRQSQVDDHLLPVEVTTARSSHSDWRSRAVQGSFERRGTGRRRCGH